MKIEELTFPKWTRVRILNALLPWPGRPGYGRWKITDVDELCKLSPRDILHTQGLGESSLGAIRVALREHGLVLRDDTPPVELEPLRCHACQQRIPRK